MPFFNKKSASDAQPVETVDESTPVGKGRPTPKRKDREAENRRPIVINDRKEARAKDMAERQKARDGIMAGDERYLTARDKGPQRRWVRDYVDARWNVGEILLPVAGLVLIASMFPRVSVIASLLLWAFFIGLIIDSLVLRFAMRSKLKRVFGAENLQKGLSWYAFMRASQMRPMRMPKPQVARGDYPGTEPQHQQ